MDSNENTPSADLLGFEHVDNPASLPSESDEHLVSQPLSESLKEFDDLMGMENKLPNEMTADLNAPMSDLLGGLDEPPAAPAVVTEPAKPETPAETAPAPTVRNPPASESQQPCCSFMGSLDPTVLDVLYWRDTKKSGIAFCSVMSLLYCIANFSIISVISHLLLALLAITMTYRIYRNLMQAVKKEDISNPFQEYLEMDLALSAESLTDVAEGFQKHINCTITKLRSVILVADIIESIKYAVLFWIFTYVGSWFNFMTLLNIFVIAMFSLPRVYEMYKEPIDKTYHSIVGNFNSTLESITSRVPFLKKKDKEE